MNDIEKAIDLLNSTYYRQDQFKYIDLAIQALQEKAEREKPKPIDKIIERLDKEYIEVKSDNEVYYNRAIFKAIDIVNQVAEEGGWIKCSDRLPELKDEQDGYGIHSELALIDTPKYGVFIAAFYETDKGWVSIDFNDYFPKEQILAWRPLPEPYKEAD